MYEASFVYKKNNLILFFVLQITKLFSPIWMRLQTKSPGIQVQVSYFTLSTNEHLIRYNVIFTGL